MAQKDTKMALAILRKMAERPPVIMSWGFSEPEVIENGLRFRENGLRYQGLCEVVHTEDTDTYTFRTIDDDVRILSEQVGLNIEDLTDFIDRAVETGEDLLAYKKAVDEWMVSHIE